MTQPADGSPTQLHDSLDGRAQTPPVGRGPVGAPPVGPGPVGAPIGRRLPLGAGRALAIAAAVVTVGLVGLAAASGNPLATRPYVRPVNVASSGATPAPTSVSLPAQTAEITWLTWVLAGFLVLCAVALVAMVVLIVVRLFLGGGSTLIRRRVLEPEEVLALTAPPMEVDLLGRGRELGDAAAQGLAALAAGSDVRASVITAWLHLEEAAAKAGTPRRDDDAPADLVGRLLAGHDVRPRRLEALAELYRRARFSPAPLDEDDRREAQRALTDVRDDLVGGVTGRPGGSAAGSHDGRPPRWT